MKSSSSAKFVKRVSWESKIFIAIIVSRLVKDRSSVICARGNLLGKTIWRDTCFLTLEQGHFSVIYARNHLLRTIISNFTCVGMPVKSLSNVLRAERLLCPTATWQIINVFILERGPFSVSCVRSVFLNRPSSMFTSGRILVKSPINVTCAKRSFLATTHWRDI